jgi:phage terminase large subunit-like protein
MANPKTQKIVSSSDRVTEYAEDVVAGKIVAGPDVRNACARHLRDLETGHERGLFWNQDQAEHKIAFFETVLKLNGGEFEGKPFILKPWQAFVVGSLHGWQRKDGTRRFRTAYIETGKGSGKSPLAAGLGLDMLAADGESRAEVYAAAVKQDQAKVLFRDAVAMVQLSPALTKRLELTGGSDPDNIAFLEKKSFFRPISSERQGRGQSGPRPHCALLDEIHEHPTNAIVEFLAAGVKHRRQPLILMITNSGSDRKSVCWEYHQYGSQICAGDKENDTFFAYICGLDKGDDPFKDEDCWIKANPSLPEIPGYDYIRTQVKAARGMPSKETLVRRLNFCEWTDAADAWLTKDEWLPLQRDLNISDYDGRECYGGLDLSISNDLTALVLAFPVGHRKWDIFSWFWMPGGKVLELQDRDGMAPHYQNWAKEGFLQTPSGKTIDYEHAAHFISDVCARFNVLGIAYDRAKIELLRKELDELGCDVPLIEHGQGFYKAQSTGLWMPGSIEEVEGAIKDGRLQVKENPVLSWCVASAVCQQSNINPSDRYFAKRKATGRIDGAVAMAMAVGVASGGVPDVVSSPWDDPAFKFKVA